MTEPEEGCGGHPGLSAELRALVLGVLDRLGPLLERVRAEPAAPAGEPPPGTGSCTACPVCAVLAVVRGERPELAVRLAEQAAGLLAVLRAALEEGDPTAPGPEPAPPPAPGRRVQHIRVDGVRARR